MTAKSHQAPWISNRFGAESVLCFRRFMSRRRQWIVLSRSQRMIGATTRFSHCRQAFSLSPFPESRSSVPRYRSTCTGDGGSERAAVPGETRLRTYSMTVFFASSLLAISQADEHRPTKRNLGHKDMPLQGFLGGVPVASDVRVCECASGSSSSEYL